MGLGTGVLRAYHLYCFMRGLTVGVVGASGLLIAERSGVPQHWLFAARGAGLIFGPLVFSPLVGRVVWSGESQCGFALALFMKAVCEMVLPRAVAGTLLIPAFFVLGLCMTVVDTHGCMLVTRVHGDRCSLPLNIYNAIYGLGAAVAPFFAIAAPSQAFDILAAIDFAIAATLVGKRFGRGKPREWKTKVRFPRLNSPPSPASPADPESGAVSPRQSGLPSGVLRSGLAFIFFGSACETAMSSWGFAFAASVLGQPPRVAAAFPATFYCAYTSMRLVVIPASMRFLPSAIVQMGTLLTLLGAVLLHLMATHVEAAQMSLGGILLCVVLIGAGTSPFFAMTLASLRRHGELLPQEQGFYGTSTALGNCLGLWLPGVFGLTAAELGWALCIFLLMSSRVRDFPWSERQLLDARAKSCGAA